MNATILNEVSIPPVKGIETSAKRHLREDNKNATLRFEKGKLVYRKSRGHSILEDLDAMKRQVDILFSKEETISSQMQDIKRMSEEHQKEIIALKGQVGRLIQASEGSTAIAHGGDALADAFLFDHDHRSDTELYRELYGLDYRQVLELYSMYLRRYKILCSELTKCIDTGADDGGILLVLNAHATLLAQGKTPSEDLKEAFESFLTKVEENWLQPANKEPTSPLGRAYYEFWRIFKEQSKIIGQKSCI